MCKNIGVCSKFVDSGGLVLQNTFTSIPDMVDQAQFPTHYHNLETRCFWSSSLFHASLSGFAPCVTSRDLFSTTFGPAHR